MAEPGIVGGTEGDRVLIALGVHRLALPIPFVQAGGPVNAYLIDNADGSLTLFDTGLLTDRCIAALHQAFAELGRDFGQVSRILVSHGHVDHFGLASHVQGLSKAKVHLHEADWNKVLQGRSVAPMDEYLGKLGLSPELVAKCGDLHVTTGAYGQRLPAVEPLAPGMRFSFAQFEGEIVPFPGHTPGLVCLHDAAHGVLFSDDQLLEKVSPNPLLELGEHGEEGAHRALVRYLESLDRLRALELSWVLPGHGAPFQDHRKTIDSLVRFYERRQGRLEASLAAGPKTAFELVWDVFGEASSLQLFLMLSEIVGNLEVLEAKGRIRHDPSENPFRYRLTGG